MTDQKFTLLSVRLSFMVLMLGLGGAFAGGNVMIGVMIGLAWGAVLVLTALLGERGEDQ